MRTMRIRGAVAMVIALGALSGCSDLFDIPIGECGNSIIEPEKGEDCDTFGVADQPGTACRPQGKLDACRYDCEAPEDGGPAPTCPIGYTCGVNGSCRAPTGVFRRFGDTITEDIVSIELADFDGDERRDVMTIGGQEIRVRYYDEAGDLENKTTVPTAGGQIALGQLTTSDNTTDFAFNVGAGFGVMRGQRDRSFIPTQYPMEIDTMMRSISLIALDVLPDQPGTEVLALYYQENAPDGEIRDPELTGKDFVSTITIPVADVSTILQPIATGNVRSGSEGLACDELVITRGNTKVNASDQGSVAMITPCKANGGAFTYVSPADVHWNELVLPQGHKVKTSARVVDLDGDGQLDVVVGVVVPCGADLCCALDAAFGAAASDGLSSAASSPPGAPDNKMAPLSFDVSKGTYLGICNDIDKSSGPERPFPLTFGDLNNDSVADLVDPTRIWEGHLVCAAGAGDICKQESDRSVQYTIAEDPAGPWSDAVIADFNMDGLPDIIGASAGDLGLDFYQGSLTAKSKLNVPLSAFRVPTRGLATFLSVGNFDGDLAPDVAFGEINSKVPDQGDSLAVLFGRPFEPPNTVIEMGQVDTMKQLTSGNFAHYTFSDDSLTDLVAVTVKTMPDPADGPPTREEQGLLFPGTTNRQLQSPVRLGGREKDPSQPQGKPILTTDVPMRIVVGQFTADPHADVAVLANHVRSTSADDAVDLNDKFPERFPLWMLRSDNDAEFPEAGKPPEMGGPPMNSKWSQEIDDLIKTDPFARKNVAMTALDLSNDGIDELLIFIPDRKESYNALFRADIQPDGLWSISPRTNLFEAGSPMAGWVTNVQTNAVDLDRDTKKDLAVLFEEGGTSGAERSFHFAVFWNESGISAKAMTALPDIMEPGNPSPVAPLAFAVLHADRDLDLDIAIATVTGIYLTEVDAAARTLSAPMRVQGLPGGTTIAAGDIDGDGVDDLVIGTNARSELFLGAAQNER